MTDQLNAPVHIVEPELDDVAPVRVPPIVILGRYSAVFLWLGFMIVFGILKGDVFLTSGTFRVAFSEGVVTAVLALAFLVPLCAGTFDLSAGAQMSLSLVIVNWFGVHTSIPSGTAAIVAVVACSLVGMVSGLIVVRLKVNSLIATLGMSQVLAAVCLRISDNRQITGAFSRQWNTLGNRNVVGIPILMFYLIGLAVIVWVVLEHTPVGRYLFAVGSNSDAARLAGLPTDRLVVGSLMASGAIAGLAGVIFSMKVGTYSAEAGPGLLFPALAAVFFGASQFKGRPNVWGTLVAYFALGFGVKGLQITFGPGTYWIQPLFQGVALLVAVGLASRDGMKRRRAKKSVPTLLSV